MGNRLVNNTLVGLTTLVATAGAAQDFQQTDISEATPIVQTVEKPQDYMGRTYSRHDSELEKKIDELYKNISGTKEEKNGVAKLIEKMASDGAGRRILMEVPKDVKIEIDHNRELEKINAGALHYGGSTNKILLSEDLEKSGQAVTLAHEMCHSIQNAEGRRAIKSPFDSDKFVQEKMCEMETKLQDIVLESRLAEKDQDKSAGCLFYESELKRFKAAGLEQIQAERAARTSVVQVYWTGLNELPNGLKEKDIPQDLRDNVNYWNNYYDLQTIYHFVHNLPAREDLSSLHQADINAAEAIENNQQKNALNENWAGIDRNNELLPEYIKKMDINLSPNWFIQRQMDKSTVGKFFVANYHSSGAIETECFCTPNGYTLREYSDSGKKNSKGNLLHETTYNKQKHRNGFEMEYHPNGRLKCQIKYSNGKTRDGIEYNDGEICDGTVIYFREDGSKEKEIEYKKGKITAQRLYHNKLDKNGNPLLKQETKYKNGKKDGIEKHFNENGSVWLEERYENDVEQESTLYKYYSNGKLRLKGPAKGTKQNETTIYNLHGAGVISYATDGKTIIKKDNVFKNGDLYDGIEPFINSDGQKGETECKNGKKVREVWYYDSVDKKGNPLIKQQDTYENNELKVRTWGHNKLSKDGKQILNQRETYENGKKTTYTSYLESFYKNEQLINQTAEFDKNENEIKRTWYYDSVDKKGNQLIEQQDVNENGELKSRTWGRNKINEKGEQILDQRDTYKSKTEKIKEVFREKDGSLEKTEECKIDPKTNNWILDGKTTLYKDDGKTVKNIIEYKNHEIYNGIKPFTNSDGQKGETEYKNGKKVRKEWFYDKLDAKGKPLFEQQEIYVDGKLKVRTCGHNKLNKDGKQILNQRETYKSETEKTIEFFREKDGSLEKTEERKIDPVDNAWMLHGKTILYKDDGKTVENIIEYKNHEIYNGIKPFTNSDGQKGETEYKNGKKIRQVWYFDTVDKKGNPLIEQQDINENGNLKSRTWGHNKLNKDGKQILNQRETYKSETEKTIEFFREKDGSLEKIEERKIDSKTNNWILDGKTTLLDTDGKTIIRTNEYKNHEIYNGVEPFVNDDGTKGETEYKNGLKVRQEWRFNSVDKEGKPLIKQQDIYKNGKLATRTWGHNKLNKDGKQILNQRETYKSETEKTIEFFREKDGSLEQTQDVKMNSETKKWILDGFLKNFDENNNFLNESKYENGVKVKTTLMNTISNYQIANNDPDISTAVAIAAKNKILS